MFPIGRVFLRRPTFLNHSSVKAPLFYGIGLAAIVLAASSEQAAAWGLDLTPDTTRYLSDPSFLPPKGHVYSNTTYDYSSTDRVWQFNPGTTNEHLSATRNFG